MYYTKDKLNNFIVGRKDTLATAMSKIEINRNRTIIIAENLRMYGLLTDGDIRKALLNGRTLTTICEVVMNRNFKVASSKKQALELLDGNIEYNVLPVCESGENFTLNSICARF